MTQATAPARTLEATMTGRSLARPAMLALLGASQLLPGALAVESVTLEIEDLAGDQWSAQGVRVQILPHSKHLSASLFINRLVLPEPVGEMRAVRLDCPSVELTATEYRCARANARVGKSLLDAAPFSGEIRYQPDTGRIFFRAGDLPLLGQRATVSGNWGAEGWTATLRAASLDAQPLQKQLARIVPWLEQAEVSSGTVSIVAALSASGDSPATVETTVAVDNLAIANEPGTVATDGLTAQLSVQLEARPAADGYDYVLSMRSDRGEAYVEPVYFNLGTAALQLLARGWLDVPAKTAYATEIRYQHAGTLEARANGQFSWDDSTVLRRLSFDVDQATLPAAYRTYLQGFLVGTPLAKLQTAGSVNGRGEIVNDEIRAFELGFAQVDADDTEQRLAIYGARGQLSWRASDLPPTPASKIEWDGGFLYSLGYGPGSLLLALHGEDISLLEGLRVPLLDGALTVNTFDARGLGSEHPAIDFDARLEPIGLRRLTARLGWPAFPGTLSGELPLLRLRDGVITVGGSLVAQVFDGTARISDLRIEEPFSANRRGSANIALDNLDLGLMTEVFTLGRITGRLDGRIDGLQTIKNRPVAFDARFYTPPGDNSRRRISRRALTNLSDIAGAGTALLSGGFLRFFEDFGYSSIGLSCRLRGDICQMGGIRTGPQGYYIVEGRGLPRIDVIGHSQDVNWPRLVSQIEEALKTSQAP